MVYLKICLISVVLCSCIVKGQLNNDPVNNDLQNNILEIFNNCSCVYNYQCDADGFIITDGKNLFDERIGEDNTTKRIKCHGGDFEGEFVCCKLKTDKLPDGSKTDPDNNSNNNKSNIAENKKPKERKCGTQLPIFNIRIFSGEDDLPTVNGEFPWLMLIYKKKGDGWIYQCVGSLIHPRVVLTANHYVYTLKSSLLKVLANSNVEKGLLGDNVALERNVEEIIKSPNYSSGALYNDVAILVLNEPFDVQNNKYPINTICLTSNISVDNERCLVAGWGKAASNQMSQVLKKVELPIVGHSKCQELLRKTRLGSRYNLHESHMCAGGELGKDACKGDGGSPLMCPTNNGDTMIQVGIVSWGIGCGQKDVPGVYADVRYSYDWITEELQKRNITI